MVPIVCSFTKEKGKIKSAEGIPVSPTSCPAVPCGPRSRVGPCITSCPAVPCALCLTLRPVCPCITVPVLSVRALRSRSPSCLSVHCRALRSPSCGGPCVLSVTRFVAGPLGGVGLPPLVCDGIDDPAVCCCQDRVPVVSLFLSRSSSVYLVALVVG